MSKRFLRSSLFLVTVFSLLANADDASLQQQIDALNQKVADLEAQASVEKSGSIFRDNTLLNRIQFNGFASFGISKTQDPRSDAAYHYGQTGEVSVSPNTWLGLRINTQLYRTGELVAQFVVKNDVKDSFPIHTEWLFLRQNLGHGFNANIGRIRFPAHIDSELIYVGKVYPTVRPSAEIYSELSMNHLDGASVDHSLSLGGWLLGSKLILWGQADDPRSGHTVRLKEVQGLVVSLENDVLAMRLGVFTSKKIIDIDEPAGQILRKGMNAQLADRLDYIASALRYDDQRFYLSAEGIVTHTRNDRFSEVRSWSLIGGLYAGPALLYIGHARQHTSNEKDLAASLSQYLQPVELLAGGSTMLVPAGQIFAPFFNRQQRNIHLGAKFDITSKVVFKAQVQYLYDFDDTRGVFETRAASLSSSDNVYLYDLAIQAVF